MANNAEFALESPGVDEDDLRRLVRRKVYCMMVCNLGPNLINKAQSTTTSHELHRALENSFNPKKRANAKGLLKSALNCRLEPDFTCARDYADHLRTLQQKVNAVAIRYLGV